MIVNMFIIALLSGHHDRHLSQRSTHQQCSHSCMTHNNTRVNDLLAKVLIGSIRSIKDLSGGGVTRGCISTYKLKIIVQTNGPLLTSIFRGDYGVDGVGNPTVVLANAASNKSCGMPTSHIGLTEVVKSALL